MHAVCYLCSCISMSSIVCKGEHCILLTDQAGQGTNAGRVMWTEMQNMAHEVSPWDCLPTTMSVLVLLYDHPTKAGDSRKIILAI